MIIVRKGCQNGHLCWHFRCLRRYGHCNSCFFIFFFMLLHRSSNWGRSRRSVLVFLLRKKKWPKNIKASEVCFLWEFRRHYGFLNEESWISGQQTYPFTIYFNMWTVSSDVSTQRHQWQPLSVHLWPYCTHPTHDVIDVMCLSIYTGYTMTYHRTGDWRLATKTVTQDGGDTSCTELGITF